MDVSMFNKKLKQTIQDQEDELDQARQLFEMMRTEKLSVQLTPDQKILDLNQNFAAAMGYTIEQLRGRSLGELVPDYVKQLACFRNFQNAVTKMTPVQDDYRFIRRDGQLTWMHINWYPLKGRDGKLFCVQGYARDITDKVQLSQEN